MSGTPKQKMPITFLPGNPAFFFTLLTHGNPFLSETHFTMWLLVSGFDNFFYPIEVKKSIIMKYSRNKKPRSIYE
jgi:hypothetical protein